jgi:hypothetical protein
MVVHPGRIQDFSLRPENLGMTELFRRAFREASRKMEKSPFSASKSHFEKTNAFLKAHSLPHPAENA